MNIQRLLRFLWYVCLDHLQIGRNYPIPNLPDKSLLCNFKNSLHKLSLVSDLKKRSCLVRSFCTDCTLGPQLVILLTKPKFHSINRIGLCLTLWMQPSNRAKTCCLAQQQTPLANIFSYWFHCGAAKGCANIARSLLGEGLVVACLRRSARMKRVHWILQNFELWEQAPLAHCTENHHHFYNLLSLWLRSIGVMWPHDLMRWCDTSPIVVSRPKCDFWACPPWCVTNQTLCACRVRGHGFAIHLLIRRFLQWNTCLALPQISLHIFLFFCVMPSFFCMLMTKFRALCRQPQRKCAPHQVCNVQHKRNATNKWLAACEHFDGHLCRRSLDKVWVCQRWSAFICSHWAQAVGVMPICWEQVNILKGEWPCLFRILEFSLGK